MSRKPARASASSSTPGPPRPKRLCGPGAGRGRRLAGERSRAEDERNRFGIRDRVHDRADPPARPERPTHRRQRAVLDGRGQPEPRDRGVEARRGEVERLAVHHARLYVAQAGPPRAQLCVGENPVGDIGRQHVAGRADPPGRGQRLLAGAGRHVEHPAAGPDSREVEHQLGRGAEPLADRRAPAVPGLGLVVASAGASSHSPRAGRMPGRLVHPLPLVHGCILRRRRRARVVAGTDLRRRRYGGSGPTQDGAVRPCPIAQAAIWVRATRPSFARMLATWVSTVRSPSMSASAIARFERPLATSAATSRSRTVSPPNRAASALRRDGGRRGGSRRAAPARKRSRPSGSVSANSASVVRAPSSARSASAGRPSRRSTWPSAARRRHSAERLPTDSAAARPTASAARASPAPVQRHQRGRAQQRQSRRRLGVHGPERRQGPGRLALG